MSSSSKKRIRIDRVENRINGKTCEFCSCWFPGDQIKRHYKIYPTHLIVPVLPQVVVVPHLQYEILINENDNNNEFDNEEYVMF